MSKPLSRKGGWLLLVLKWLLLTEGGWEEINSLRMRNSNVRRNYGRRY